MDPKDLSAEAWREYEWGGETLRINEPVRLWVGETGHRVQDAAGVVHWAPKPGPDSPVRLRWMPKDAGQPVQF